MTLLAFHFEGTLNEQSFEEQLMTRLASILSHAIRHTLSSHGSPQDSFGKGMRTKPYFFLIHNM